MGFFGSVEQMHFAKEFLRDFAGEDTIVVVDPVLGDNGALYGCFTEEYVQAMRTLCESAQHIHAQPHGGGASRGLRDGRTDRNAS